MHALIVIVSKECNSFRAGLAPLTLLLFHRNKLCDSCLQNTDVSREALVVGMALKGKDGRVQDLPVQQTA